MSAFTTLTITREKAIQYIFYRGISSEQLEEMIKALFAFFVGSLV